MTATDATTKPNQRYTLLKKLATGGMGSVWLATDEKLGRSVAYKVIETGEGDAEMALRRFRREASALAQLRSTHIVEVYDFGIHQGQPFMVMELLTGMSLQKKLRSEGRLTFEDAYAIVVQAGFGLRTAHGSGIVHRDLKPSNIFLTMRDDRLVVKLIDFGVAKEANTAGSSEDTATGVLVGTPQYMSPEQVRGSRDVDHRSDLWALAVVLYRLLTGVSPFSGASVGDIALRICSDSLPNIKQHLRDAPSALAIFFEKAFQRDRDRRFQSIEEFIAALGPAMGFPELRLANGPARPSLSGSLAIPMSLSDSGEHSGPGKAGAGSRPSSNLRARTGAHVAEREGHPNEMHGGLDNADATRRLASGSGIQQRLGASAASEAGAERLGTGSDEPSWLGHFGENTPPSSTVAGTQMRSIQPQRRRKTQIRLATAGFCALVLVAIWVVVMPNRSTTPGLDSSAAATSAPARATATVSAGALRQSEEPTGAASARPSSSVTAVASAQAPAASTPKNARAPQKASTSTHKASSSRQARPRPRRPKQPSPRPKKAAKSKVNWF